LTSLFKNKINKFTIYSAIFSILYYKGFSILRSLDMDESANIICNMVCKMIRNKEKKEFYVNNLLDLEQNNFESGNINKEYISNNKAYCKVVKKIKKENITKENIGEIMLCQIPGISSQTALAILNKFQTISNLILNIQQDENCLNNICTIDSNKKSRKISKNSIEKIINFLK
jgi:ERCC4-type nuclease